jgi:UDP-N-acetylglucosamine acyltransferase
MIHPTASIHPKATIGEGCQIGPYAVIDADVILGPGCCVGPHVHLTGHTTIGSGNRFHAGAVIGDAPQDLRYRGEPTCLRIGDGNVFREHVTVHRSNTVSEATEIGSHNFFMASSHVGHNSRIGNHVIMANGALIAGHVEVGDRAFISGTCLVHQFVRIGTLALMQGRAGISKDLPPFTIARGVNSTCGLNVIGLRRAGFSVAERMELKRLYAALFRKGKTMQAALAGARLEFSSPRALELIEFVATSKRGVCGADRDLSASLDE